MVKQKYKVNLFDAIIAVFFVLIVCLAVSGWNNKPYLGAKDVIVSVETIDTQSIKNILPIVEQSNNKRVFYSGTKYPVIQKSYSYSNNSNGEVNRLVINLKGLGDIIDNNSIFNGQRIYNNQKVEIRSDYYLQAFVMGFKYED